MFTGNGRMDTQKIMLYVLKFIIVFIVLIGWGFENTVCASEIMTYYKNFQLTETSTEIANQEMEAGETAQGINTVGVKGNLFNTVFFQYELPQGTEQESLKEYENKTTEIEDYYSNMNLGLKLLSFLNHRYLKNTYIEYSKDVYQLEFETFTKFYSQELLFLGLFSESDRTGVNVKFGLFLHNNEKENLILETNLYEEDENKNVYGLMVQYNDIFVPYNNGSPSGLEKYGTGILIDDIKVQYQIAGGDDYFFSCGLGLAHRSKTLHGYAKYVFEITTDTLVGKAEAGIGYQF